MIPQDLSTHACILQIDPTEFAVIFNIVGRANPETPSPIAAHKDIAANLGLSQDGVDKVVRRLKGKGFLEAHETRNGDGRGANRYTWDGLSAALRAVRLLVAHARESGADLGSLCEAHRPVEAGWLAAFPGSAWSRSVQLQVSALAAEDTVTLRRAFAVATRDWPAMARALNAHRAVDAERIAIGKPDPAVVVRHLHEIARLDLRLAASA